MGKLMFFYQQEEIPVNVKVSTFALQPLFWIQGNILQIGRGGEPSVICSTTLCAACREAQTSLDCQEGGYWISRFLFFFVCFQDIHYCREPSKILGIHQSNVCAFLLSRLDFSSLSWTTLCSWTVFLKPFFFFLLFFLPLKPHPILLGKILLILHQTNNVTLWFIFQWVIF